MEKEERLKQLALILEDAGEPVNGLHLAEALCISRQAIVQDIALLRERGRSILATSRGYVLRGNNLRRTFAVRHDPEQIAEELNAIIAAGGRVLDVMIDHPVYGEIRGNLDLGSKEEAARFVNMLKSSGQSPLLSLSNGFHIHTVEAPNEQTLDAIESALLEKGFLEV
ncbi:MAG: transcription repressor NadR [Thermovirgaceae bacterium]|nr:transcription repressor NadR [Thermovirgaceae bacterium]